MAWTSSDVLALEQLIRDQKGAIEIAFADQIVKFGTRKEALDFLAQMRREVLGGSRTRYAATRKGC